jgi:hypothetical protein
MPCPAIVDETLSLDPVPKVIWMQLTVRHDEAAARADAAGLKVVMNRCPKIEYARLSGEIGWNGINSGVISSRKPVMRSGFQSYGLQGANRATGPTADRPCDARAQGCSADLTPQFQSMAKMQMRALTP